MVRKTKKIGRPPLTDEKRRSRSIMFRATADLAERLDRAAQKAGISLSGVIVDRLDAGIFDENGELLRDLASALRIVGDWKGDEKKAERFRAVARLIVDAHVGGRVPTDLLESRRHGSTEARVLAHVILANSSLPKGGNK